MSKRRSRGIEFKRQAAQGFIAGETLPGLAQRHDVSRGPIRIRVAKHEAGASDEDAGAADLLQAHEAKIAAPRSGARALGRSGGRRALELEFPKGFRKARHGREAGLDPCLPARRPAGLGLGLAQGCRPTNLPPRSTRYAVPSRKPDDALID